jgi:hypothetical protein
VTALDRVIGIAAFVHGGAALRDDGTVWMWGEDREGLLATGTLTKSWQSGKQQFTPQRIAGLEAVTQIAGSEAASAARWPDLPQVTTINAPLDIKPAATVLLNGTDERLRAMQREQHACCAKAACQQSPVLACVVRCHQARASDVQLRRGEGLQPADASR